MVKNFLVYGIIESLKCIQKKKCIYRTLIRMATIKERRTEQVLGRVWKNWNPHALLWNCEMGQPLWEKGMEVTQKAKCSISV